MNSIRNERIRPTSPRFFRASRAAALGGLASLALWTEARGATEWRFWPSASLELYRDGNVEIVGARKTADNVARLGVGLDLSANNPPTSFLLEYRGSREGYQDRSELDNTGHQLAVLVSHELSRRSSFAAALRGWLAYYHPVHTLDPSRPTTLVPRTRETSLDLELTGRVGAGKRSFVDWGVNQRTLDYESPELRGQSTLRASAGWGVQLSAMSDVGVRLVAQRLDVDRLSPVDTRSLEAFYNRQFRRAITLSAEAGRIRSDSGSRVGHDARFGVSAAYRFPLGTTVSGGALQDVSAGWGAKSPTRDRGVYLSLEPGRRSRRFKANVTAYSWRRDALDRSADVQDVDTREAIASFEWLPGRRRFGIGAFASYHDQQDVSRSNPALRITYASGGISFRYTFRVEEAD